MSLVLFVASVHLLIWPSTLSTLYIWTWMLIIFKTCNICKNFRAIYLQYAKHSVAKISVVTEKGKWDGCGKRKEREGIEHWSLHRDQWYWDYLVVWPLFSGTMLWLWIVIYYIGNFFLFTCDNLIKLFFPFKTKTVKCAHSHYIELHVCIEWIHSLLLAFLCSCCVVSYVKYHATPMC